MGILKINKFQNIIRFKTSDGFVITALFVTREYKNKKDIQDVPVLLQVHGLMGHFLARGTTRVLPNALLMCGLGSLTINTRLAFTGQMTGEGIFDDTIYDIDASIEFLTQEGFKNIFAIGYSLGSTILVHWAANRKHPNVRGLILEGMCYSMSEFWRKAFEKFGSIPSYNKIYKKAKSLLGDDPYSSPNDEVFVVYQSRGPNREPGSSEIFTYKTWWFMAGPEAYNAMGYKHIGKVDIPLLIIRGENDFLVEKWEPEALAGIAREAGNKDVYVKKIPDARHDCMENPDATLDNIVDFYVKYSICNSV